MTDGISIDATHANTLSRGTFPELVGLEMSLLEHGRAEGVLEVRQELLAPNGFLHAGVIVTLADTVAGFGCRASLPDGASGFATIELKSNFIGTARRGILRCEAMLVHGGRTTQVWDARVLRDEDGVAIALFRCTQMVLYPRAKGAVTNAG